MLSNGWFSYSSLTKLYLSKTLIRLVTSVIISAKKLRVWICYKVCNWHPTLPNKNNNKKEKPAQVPSLLPWGSFYFTLGLPQLFLKSSPAQNIGTRKITSGNKNQNLPSDPHSSLSSLFVRSNTISFSDHLVLDLHSWALPPNELSIVLLQSIERKKQD